MSEFTTNNVPGFHTQQTAEEKQIWWSGRGGQTLIATRQVTIAAASQDAGSTPVTTLRAGLVMALNASTGKAHPYDPDANDGTQVPFGILERPVNMLVDGTATDRFAQVLVQGLVKEAELVGLDARARQQLSSRFLFDRHLDEAAGPMQPRSIQRVSSNMNVAVNDQGTLFIATAAVTFTLPAAAHGLSFRFLQAADNDLTIAGSSNLIHKGSAGASSVAFTTSNQKIGSQVLVECVYTAASTLRWIVTNLGGTSATVT
jgi:hypothetical protein